MTGPGETANDGHDPAFARAAARNHRRIVFGGQVGLLLALLALWHFGSGVLFDPFYMGTPTGVAAVLFQDFSSPRFYRDLWVTAVEMGAGYLGGALGGIILGILLSQWRLVAEILDPYFSALNSIPRIALAPLLVIWFGIDLMPKIVLAATLVFFLTFYCTLSGIRDVEKSLIDVARVVGANERQIFRHVVLPGASAWIINGLKMSLPYALIGVIVGEFLISSSGLGYRLNAYSTAYNTNGTFAMLLVMMALMMALNAIVSFIERRALSWRPPVEGTAATAV